MLVLKTNEIMKLYDQPWRYYHNKTHLNTMLDKAVGMLVNQPFTSGGALENAAKRVVENEEFDVLKTAIVFHDCVYEPERNDNEEKSSEMWMKFSEGKGVPDDFVREVSKLILSTKHPEDCKTKLEVILRNLDWNFMGETHEITPEYGRWLASYEDGVFREYQKFPIWDEKAPNYVKGRLDFLSSSVSKGLMTKEVADFLRPLVLRKKTVGIYAGSFNPFHVGHLNVLRKAEQMFDKVIVGRGVNAEKKGIAKSEYDNLERVLRHHQVESYSGQLVEYVDSKRNAYCEPVLVRGLRNGYDLDYEMRLVSFMNEQADARKIRRIPVVYVHSDKEYEHISSSAIRTLEPIDVERYIPNEQ